MKILKISVIYLICTALFMVLLNYLTTKQWVFPGWGYPGLGGGLAGFLFWYKGYFGAFNNVSKSGKN
jgi:hypothetical protein